MQNKSKKDKIYLLGYVLLCVLVLAIGYAILTTTILNTRSKKKENYITNTSTFNVHFINSSISPRIVKGIGTAYISDDKKSAYFDITSLAKKGDIAIVEYTIYNESIEYNAILDIKLSNTNSEYFKVTKKLEDKLLKEGTATILTIKVELEKIPIKGTETTRVSGTIIATPKQ